jgi:lipid II isoglutaminyl synthase (glutamine-hydrolysing)
VKFRLLSLYPDQMNIYADRGNILFLKNRCEWRGIDFELTGCSIGGQFEPGAHDLLYIGGGQDRDQKVVAEDLVESKRDLIREYVELGHSLLAVCGGYQLLGSYYEIESDRIEGLGLIDLHTVRSDGPRLIGPVAIETTIGGRLRRLAGFENHGGRTWLGPGAEPLGKVIAGHGNNGEDGFEGILDGNVIGTYLHGPLLPKNAWLADHLIETSLRKNYGPEVELESLDDGLEDAAHVVALAAAVNDR